MKTNLLLAAATASLACVMLPAGSVLAQSRAAADAAMERMGLVGDGNDVVRFERSEFDRGRYILHDVVFTDLETGTDEATGDVTEDLRAERLIFEAPRLSGSGDVLLDGLVIEGLSAVSDDSGTVFGLDHFEVDGPNALMAADLGRVFAGEVDEDYEPDWNLYEFDAFRFEGLTGQSTAGEKGGESFDLALDQFVIENYSRVELGRMALLGMRLNGQSPEGPVRFNLDEMSVIGFKTEAYAEMFDAIAAGADESAITDAYYDSAFSAGIDVFDRFAVRGVDLAAAGMEFTLGNMVGEIEQRGSRYISTASLDSARFMPDASQPEGAEVASAIGLLGYEDIELSMEANSIYDEDTGRYWTTGENYLQIRDGLRIEFAQDLGGYDEYFAALPAAGEAMRDAEEKDDEEATLQASLDLMGPIVLHNLTVRLVDLSLLERALTAGATAQGVTVDDMRAQAAAMVTLGTVGAPPEVPRPLLMQVSNALVTFINQGGSMTIDMTPPVPLSVADIAAQIEAGSFDYDALGLTVTNDTDE